ncbi:MOSC domain-containing protein [Rhodovulum sp. P5]|uniref:MOSC domain-containing protein n=1 Tax=Rhodovulum sp. P5 TaxID=1564506 RepID=UPI0009DAE81F|nr:MOSC domain-containing protein [Rhodovulum sp. P5]
MTGTVVSVARDGAHRFSKTVVERIELIAGVGVAGDAHAGETVQHRSRVRQDPSQPNLRQVHLIGVELFDALATKSFDIAPGDLGENIATRGIDLLTLPVGTRLGIGSDAVVELTGLRNPCQQIEDFRPGLLDEVLERGPGGHLIRKAGVMAIVREPGVVVPGDRVSVTLPAPPHRALERV